MGSRRILILGLGREGFVLARYFASRGDSVTVTDSTSSEQFEETAAQLNGLGVRLALGENRADLVADTDQFFVSPGVPESNEVYRAALARGLEIDSMTRLFFRLCPCRTVGISGSSGKTTTTGLIGSILDQAGFDVKVGGNIGEPMLRLLPDLRPSSIAVLELSSFQLSLLRQSPHVAVVTNISPNHLDRHETMDAYLEAKSHLVKHQSAGDTVIVNSEDPAVLALAGMSAAGQRSFGANAQWGATSRRAHLGLIEDGEFTPVIDAASVPLAGQHNQRNVLAAIATAAALGVEPVAMREGIRRYQPAPHRLETIAIRDGVRYVDDSIATTPDRAATAIVAQDRRPTLLIAGGRDKHLSWDDFARLAVERLRAIYLLGEAAPLIADAIETAHQEVRGTLDREMVRRVASLDEAVELARRDARPGDVVLLAPGCASYDMFTNFEERGHAFARAAEPSYAL
ncbi:MAG: UDP-N-acetylmuramoyl-L-alanine--D-glutamate ligase [Chloroflexota bacterium]